MSLHPVTIYNKFISKIKFSSKTNTIKLAAMTAIIIIITTFILYIKNKVSLNKGSSIVGSSSEGENCDLLKKLYTTKPPLISAVDTPSLSEHSLRDFYIKTAYNCCCSGNFKNDFVNLCALRNCIEQGVRCLDFEIYSIDNKPVVAASAINSYTTKQTYNSIPIEQVFATINDMAFSSGGCSNFNDPLILHFRMSSNNVPMYNALGNIISTMLNQRVLGPRYSNEYNGKNLGEVSLYTFKQKIIIIVDSSNPLYRNTKLFEYVNMASGSPFLHIFRYNSVKYTQDINLTNFNKQNMTMVLPDLASFISNPNYHITNTYGCQMTGLSFQRKDTNLSAYNDFFNAARFAFVLKPEDQRYIPDVVEEPQALPSEYSYAPRQIKGDFYDYQI